MRDRERFFLRLCLLHIRGATCWADLKTVNGVLHSTHEEAAVAMGIADNDKEWEFCLQEVSPVYIYCHKWFENQKCDL
jgi:hypothetical protein